MEKKILPLSIDLPLELSTVAAIFRGDSLKGGLAGRGTSIVIEVPSSRSQVLVLLTHCLIINTDINKNFINMLAGTVVIHYPALSSIQQEL